MRAKQILSMICMAILASLLTSAGPCNAQKQETAEGPATIILDSLAKYYDPVEFDHGMHIEYLENDCSHCHHHTIGTPGTGTQNCKICHKYEPEAKIVACRGCHLPQPYTTEGLLFTEEEKKLFHKGKPSLKGAYHQFCISCHKEVDGPYTCDGCHMINDKGEQLFREGKYAPPKRPAKTGHGGEGH
ncbi:MAG: cytochrome c family protein [Desulfobacterales bacterium]|nr:cytochrome c family protein [Desulfobacterales bacterium]